MAGLLVVAILMVAGLFWWVLFLPANPDEDTVATTTTEVPPVIVLTDDPAARQQLTDACDAVDRSVLESAAARAAELDAPSERDQAIVVLDSGAVLYAQLAPVMRAYGVAAKEERFEVAADAMDELAAEFTMTSTEITASTYTDILIEPYLDGALTDLRQVLPELGAADPVFTGPLRSLPACEALLDDLDALGGGL